MTFLQQAQNYTIWEKARRGFTRVLLPVFGTENPEI